MDHVSGWLIGGAGAVFAGIAYICYLRRAAQNQKNREATRKYLGQLAADATKGYDYALTQLRDDEITAELFGKHGMTAERLAAIEHGERAQAEHQQHGVSLIALFSHWMNAQASGFETQVQACLAFFRLYDALEYCRPLLWPDIGYSHDELVADFNRTIRTAFEAYLALARTERGDEPRFQAALELLCGANTSFDLKTILVDRLKLPLDWEELCQRYAEDDQ